MTVPRALAAGFLVARLALIGLAAASLSSAEGDAAVRVCKEVIASDRVRDETETGAKKRALDAWKAKAASFGEGYTSWRLAADKFLHCLPVKTGGYECLARGAPCIIDNAPSRRQLREKRIGI